MTIARLAALAVLAGAAPAAAQDQDLWVPLDCAEVEAGPGKAVILECREAAPFALSDQAPLLDVIGDGAVGEPFPPTEAPAPPPDASGDEAQIPGQRSVPRPAARIATEAEVPVPTPVPIPEVAATEDRVDNPPTGDPLGPSEVELLDDDLPPGLLPAPEGTRYAIIDGVLVPLDPESYEIIRRSAGTAGLRSGSTPLRSLRIPSGHLPPPGSCRAWFPDRPPGQQPPPTACDTPVPRGAVRIRG